MRNARIVAWMACLTLLAGAANAGQLDKLLHAVEKKAPATSQSHAGGALPASEIASGLKEALATGTTNAIKSLGRVGGFQNNAAVRIPLPGKLREVGKLARELGQGAKVDAFQASLNRAAEKAVPQVADIFGDAIRKMSLADARGILAGGDHAATDYFRRVSGDALKARIEPIVSKATDSVGVTKRYKALTSSAGGAAAMLGGGHELDLDDYVTDKTLDGLFTTIADEEKSIRTNPAARVTGLLKKVFGR